MLKVEVLMPGSTFNKVRRLAPGIGNAIMNDFTPGHRHHRLP